MKTDDLLQVQAYLDNELSAAEARKVAHLISTDAEAQRIHRELKEMRELVVANEPMRRLDEPMDFYWSQIKRQIESGERKAEHKPKSNWLMRWVAPLAGACAVLALALSVMHVGGDKKLQVTDRAVIGPEMPPTIAQNLPANAMKQIEGAEMSTITFRSESEGMTVVWISNDI
jgi:anti-sigma factor RsiW